MTKVEKVDVFISGTEGFHTFRIPSIIVTKDGSVLAFCEGRANRADHSHNKIALKISSDGGRTWGPIRIIAADGDHCLNNPFPVLDAETGRILLMYNRWPWGFHEKDVVAGYQGQRINRCFVMFSDDSGSKWSPPGELTRQVKPEGATAAVPTGVGIQLSRGLRRGRLIMPFVIHKKPNRGVTAVYSDDSGESWLCGETAADDLPGMAGEVQIVEMADGGLQLNARNIKGGQHRKVSESRDNGMTWSDLRFDEELIEPGCMASVIRWNGNILFSNPAHEKERVNGVVRLSSDDGKTWSRLVVLEPGRFAYSCLTVFANGSIGCLYETGTNDPYEKIVLARFGSDALKLERR